jgi:hypothetical protein
MRKKKWSLPAKNGLALRRSRATVLAMNERTPIQQEIHTLLRQAEQKGEVVTDLARVLLKRFRAECGSIFEFFQKDLASALLEQGQADTDVLARERDERLEEARRGLKARLEALLRTAEEKKL